MTVLHVPYTCRDPTCRTSSPVRAKIQLYRGNVVQIYNVVVQGYLAHKKPPPPQGPPEGPRHKLNVGCEGGAVSYERGTPVHGNHTRRTARRTSSQLKAQGSSRTCNESKEEEEEHPFHARGLETSTVDVLPR